MIYSYKRSAKCHGRVALTRTAHRTARLEDICEDIANVVAALAAASAKLGHALNPRTAAHLAGLVRIMNAYYSNLIEGHRTLPADIERALAENFDADAARQDLQVEAVVHVRV